MGTEIQKQTQKQTQTETQKTKTKKNDCIRLIFENLQKQTQTQTKKITNTKLKMTDKTNTAYNNTNYLLNKNIYLDTIK